MLVQVVVWGRCEAVDFQVTNPIRRSLALLEAGLSSSVVTCEAGLPRPSVHSPPPAAQGLGGKPHSARTLSPCLGEASWFGTHFYFSLASAVSYLGVFYYIHSLHSPTKYLCFPIVL